MPTKIEYRNFTPAVNISRAKSNVRAKKNSPAIPTPREIVERALAHYAVHVAQSGAEVAMTAEALRLLHEHTEAADTLFAPDTESAASSATDKQRDLLAKLGYEGDVHNCGHASAVIANLLANCRRSASQRTVQPEGGQAHHASSREGRAQ